MSSEAEFLRRYNVHDFDVPLTTVDSVLFTVHDEQLKVLLVKRAEHPAKDKWALPGGFIDLKADKSLEQCAVRKLKEKTGVEPPYIEQLMSVGNAKRDPRGWSVTVVFYALVSHQACESRLSSVADVQWVAVDTLARKGLAFDHKAIVQEALRRLQQKALYSIVPVYALPELFTLSELQQLHEIILGKPLQKKSFRRRIEMANLLEDSGQTRIERGPPAKLYRAIPTAGAYTFIRNLEG